MAQKYTSKNTSVNSTKLPKLHSMILTEKFGELDDFELTIFDYGCGKYTDHIKKAYAEKGISYIGMDKYNQSFDHNENAMMKCQAVKQKNLPLVCTCSNVFNVIDDDEEIRKCIRIMLSFADFALITVYEGDKSGIGKATKEDCYQRNAKLKDYEAIVKSAGCYNVSFEKGVMLVSRF